MTLLFSTGLRNAILDSGIGPAFDTTGRIAFFNGTDPSAGGDAIGGTLLATLTLASDAFGDASSGTITAGSITGDSSADATGTANYAVVYRTGDTAITSAAGTSDRRLIITNITATGGGGEITLDTTTITATAPVNITSWTITFPASS